MRVLYVMRHGEAELQAATDHARNLSVNGREQVRRVGLHMVENNMRPQLALVSSAQRTRESSEILLPLLPEQPQLSLEDTIYSGDVDTLLGLVRAVPDSVQRVLLIGHNPSLSYLVAALVRPRRMPGLSTASFRAIEFSTVWDAVAPGVGSLSDEFNP